MVNDLNYFVRKNMGLTNDSFPCYDRKIRKLYLNWNISLAGCRVGNISFGKRCCFIKNNIGLGAYGMGLSRRFLWKIVSSLMVGEMEIYWQCDKQKFLFVDLFTYGTSILFYIVFDGF